LQYAAKLHTLLQSYGKIEKENKKPKKKTNLKGKSSRTKKTDKKIDRKQLIENKRKYFAD